MLNLDAASVPGHLLDVFNILFCAPASSYDSNKGNDKGENAVAYVILVSPKDYVENHKAVKRVKSFLCA